MPTGVYERRPLQERFDAKVNKTETCWLWTGHTNGRYGAMRVNCKSTYAHRVSYELHVGPIPEGLEIDHLCRVLLCVNPDHLEPVTHAENLRRARVDAPCPTCEVVMSPISLFNHTPVCAGEVMACGFGHEFTEENTYLWRGKRQCRACRTEASRRKSEKRKRLRQAAARRLENALDPAAKWARLTAEEES